MRDEALAAETVTYAYPADLARLVQERWATVQGEGEALPELATLNRFFSACYQASLLREEERPVTFRAVLASPELFPAHGMPPESLQRLEFADSFPFDASELRRLSVATDTQRTIVGVRRNDDGELRIWGLVNSGTWWLRDIRGGRRAGAPLPAVPVVHVDAPGSIAAYKGHELVADLRSGRLSGSRVDPFVSRYLLDLFADFRTDLAVRHERARGNAVEPWAVLEPDLQREISHRMLKRVIALLRDGRHGGSVVFVPMTRADDLCSEDVFIDLKYRFENPPGQRCFSDLVEAILNRVAVLHGAARGSQSHPVGWREFETSRDEELSAFDEALFESAHLIAGLASADGAVVLNMQHDILGFGGMISGRLPPVRSVARALDLEANTVRHESTTNVGARHQSAYRLVNAMRGAVVIVISQDGGVRFVAHKDGRVTYWEQE